MKICAIVRSQRTSKRNVDLFGTRYVFERITDDAGKNHLVADVKDKAHQDTFLANPGYYELGKARIRRQEQPPAPAPGDTGTTDQTDATPEDTEEAVALLAEGVREISSSIGNVSSMAVVREALRQEEASEKPRKTVTKLLEDTIEGARQAGVE